MNKSNDNKTIVKKDDNKNVAIKQGQIWRCNKTNILYKIINFDGVVDYKPLFVHQLEAEVFERTMAFVRDSA